MAKVFTKKVYIDRPETSTEPKDSRSLKKFVRGMIIGLIVLGVVGFAVFQFGLFINSITSRWQELQFAYTNPQIVKHVREDYQSQQKKVEQSFLQNTKSNEQQLVDQVVAKLKSDSLKP